MDDTGPVIDWLQQLVAALWAMVQALVAAVAAELVRVRQDVAELANGLSWLPWKAFAALAVLVAIHAWITRPRQGV